MNNVIEILGKVLIGAHPKTSVGGWLLAAALLAVQVSDWYNNKPTDPALLAAAAAAVGIGRSLRDPSAKQDPPGPTPPPAGGAAAGSGELRLLLALALICILTGCGTIMAKVQSTTDGWAEKTGQTNLLFKVRNGIAESEGAKVGRTVLPADAVQLPEAYEDDDHAPLTNGVTAVQWFKVSRRLAPKLAKDTPPPSQSNPSPAPAAHTDPGTPPGEPQPQPAGAGGLFGPPTGSLTVEE